MFFSDLLYYSHCLATLSLLSLLLSLHKSSTSFFSSFPTLFCSSSSLYCHTVPPSSSTQCQFFRSFSLFPLFLICVLSVLSFSLTPPLSLSFSSSVSMSCCRVLESGSVTGNRVPWDLCTLLLRSENCLHNMKGEREEGLRKKTRQTKRKLEKRGNKENERKNWHWVEEEGGTV